MNSTVNTPPLQPGKLQFADLGHAIRSGWQQFRLMPALSMAYALLFVLLGGLIFFGLEHYGIAPLSVSFAGGFMLVGPALLAGFFALSDAERRDDKPQLRTIWQGFRQLPRGGWVISLVCALLFLIWITDAGTVYGFMIGRETTRFNHLISGSEAINRFLLFSSIGGAVLAFIIFTISAFSIPLIYDHRCKLVAGVAASVRTVFGNFIVCMSWAALLAVSIMVSALILPWLLLVLPVMAYASRALYFKAFPSD